MNDEQIKDNLKEDSIWSMARDFYSRKMLSIVILVWIDFLIFFGLIIFSGIKFFATDQTKAHILYAAIFVCCVQCICMIKIFAWQMIHRKSIKQEIKRLELHIAELKETVKNK